MTFRVAVDGIWREFNDVEEAVCFVVGRCSCCRKECKGMFCRPCYSTLTADERRAIVAKHRGRMLGAEIET